ncbi:MAG: cytochrome d ubiquinol oxidase subunit II [Bacillota bacterium]
MDLNTAWFLLVGILIVGYAILDGFDLGVGTLYYLLAKNDDEKRQLLNAIGPFWDANEVWLLTGGGALFAAFPLVYATVFSGFYLALMLVLFALIFRAVAIEFRNKDESPAWHNLWDRAFFLGSALPALLFGVALGNVLKGLPLDSQQYYTGGFLGLLNPFALLVGVLGLAAFLQQGATYVMMKTGEPLAGRARQLLPGIWGGVVALYLAVTLFSWLVAPHLFTNFSKYPWLWILPLLTWLAMGAVIYFGRRGQGTSAFLASSLTMAGLVLIAAAGLYPNLVPALDPARSLTIYNASSSPLTLKVMLIIALCGVPIVLGYTVFVHWLFRGKVKPDAQGY